MQAKYVVDVFVGSNSGPDAALSVEKAVLDRSVCDGTEQEIASVHRVAGWFSLHHSTVAIATQAYGGGGGAWMF